MSARHSNVALVLVKLRVDDRDCILFHRHPKWGDWSLIGGHVEESEERNWFRAATREASEELAPLRLVGDFEIHRWLTQPLEWGPVPSRSHRDAQTIYRVRYFSLAFTVDPTACFRQLPKTDFLLVDGTDASAHERLAISETFTRLVESLPRGQAEIPRSWPRAIAAADAIIPRFHDDSSDPAYWRVEKRVARG